MSAWLATILSPVSALFSQKNIRENQPACEDCLLPDEEMKRRTFWRVSKKAKARMFKGVYYHANFSNLTNVFALLIVFPLNLVIKVFLASKVRELL